MTILVIIAAFTCAALGYGAFRLSNIRHAWNDHEACRVLDHLPKHIQNGLSIGNSGRLFGRILPFLMLLIATQLWFLAIVLILSWVLR